MMGNIEGLLNKIATEGMPVQVKFERESMIFIAGLSIAMLIGLKLLVELLSKS